jgi:DNA repair photolyase
MGPVLPFLTDSPGQLEATVRLIAEAGAAHVTPIVLHLRPGAREWFLRWLGEHFPELEDSYRRLYGAGAYAPKAYQRQITEQVRELALRYGVGRASPGQARSIQPRGIPRRGPAQAGEPPLAGPPGGPPGEVQLTLL